MPEENEYKPIRISSFAQASSSGPYGNELSIKGLTKKEFDEITAMIISGANWITTDDKGRLKTQPTRKPLSSPVQDEDMLPFWSSVKQGELFKPKSLIKFDDIPGYLNSPSFYISSLCGYGYTPEFYRESAEKLESFGFECMRSRRGKDSRFWEVWYLPGLMCAKGSFGEFLEKTGEKSAEERIKKAIDFLCKTISFGSLDVVIQRACAAFGD